MIRLQDILKEVNNYTDIFTNNEYNMLVDYLNGRFNNLDKSKLIQLIKRLQKLKTKYTELQTKYFDKAYRIDLLDKYAIPVPLYTLDVEYGGERYGVLFGGQSTLQLAKLDSIPFRSKSELTGWTIDKDFAFEMLYDTSKNNDFTKTFPILYEIDYNENEFIFDVDFLENIRTSETGYGYESEVLRIGPNINLSGYVVYTYESIPDYDASGIDTPGNPNM